MSSKRKIEERIEAKLEEKRQLEAQIKQLLQQQRTQEQKDRTHRLCKRGGLVEKYLPDLIKLTDDQFQVFINKCLLSNFTMKTLSELVAANDGVNVEGEADNLKNNANSTLNTSTTVENMHIVKSSETAA